MGIRFLVAIVVGSDGYLKQSRFAEWDDSVLSIAKPAYEPSGFV